MSRQPRAQVDVPVVHLARRYNTFRPPLAKDPEEISRRKQLRRGTLLLEFQARGLQLGASILDRVSQSEDIRFTAGALAMMGNNSSWHTMAERAPTVGKDGVTRRIVKMPKAYDAETGRVVLPDELVAMGRTAMGETADMAQDLATAYGEGKSVKGLALAFGRRAGTTAVLLAGIHHDVAAEIVTDPFAVQDAMRAAYLDITDESRTFGLGNRQHPTFAQFAYEDSPVSVYFREQGPLGAVQAYHAAIAETAQPGV